MSATAGIGFGWYGITSVFIWAFLDEVTKIPIPGRHFSWFDVALNMLGAAVGMMVTLMIIR